MRCEEVREHLAELLLETSGDPEVAEARRHVRGCAACRTEMARLDDGLATFSNAAHDVEPPGSLQGRVLGVLEEEWASEPPRRRLRTAHRLAWASTLIILAGSLIWGLSSKLEADRYEAEAGQWRQFLAALGGKDVRIGTFQAAGTRSVEGSVVVYDSDDGRSWALVLVRAPGRLGTARAMLSDEHRVIRLPELEFDEGGEAHALLVTGSSLEGFDTVTITGNGGVVLATATVSGG